MSSVADSLFVGGEWVRAGSSARHEVVNPATEDVIGSVLDADGKDVDLAVGAARAALRSTEWRGTTPTRRADYLRSLATALEKRGEDIAILVTRQNGMPIALSRYGNALGPVGWYRYFADLADALELEETRIGAYGTRSMVRREPVGVAALIVPWNGPQALLSWKLGPALAAGCTVVIKPSPETSLDMELFAEAVQEADIPPGVINIVPGGRETGAALVAHEGVDKIAFTGSTAAGQKIAEMCAAQLKPATLELGGKSAAIVLDDVDLDAFLGAAPMLCMPNSGQICNSLTRVLVSRARHDDVVAGLSAALQQIKVGDPFEETTMSGPLVAARQRDRVESYIRIGLEEGAGLVTGGTRHPDFEKGYYMQPTLFANVNNSMRVAREEIFGPVVVVIPYENEEEAISIANDSDYGLAGAVFTRNVEHGIAVARRIETGTVGVNTYAPATDAPFGGRKRSGLGRELGRESVDPYLEYQSIYLPTG